MMDSIIKADKFDPDILPLPFDGVVCFDGEKWYISTPDGDLQITPGDYIVMTSDGNYYPSRADIFEAKWVPLDNGGILYGLRR